MVGAAEKIKVVFLEVEVEKSLFIHSFLGKGSLIMTLLYT